MLNLSPTEGHFGCFQFLAITNKAGINNYLQVFVWVKVFAFWTNTQVHLRWVVKARACFIYVYVCVSMGNLFSRVKIPSRMTVSFTSSHTQHVRNPIFLKPCKYLILQLFYFYFSHSDRCIVLALHVFKLAFP